MKNSSWLVIINLTRKQNHENSLRDGLLYTPENNVIQLQHPGKNERKNINILKE